MKLKLESLKDGDSKELYVPGHDEFEVSLQHELVVVICFPNISLFRLFSL